MPSSAILHLHDRDWIYTPAGGKDSFRRIEVQSGKMLPSKMQEVISGVAVLGTRCSEECAGAAEYGGAVER